MYVISPYVPKEKIFDIIGMKSNIIKSSVSEGTHNIIFINQGEIVCYLYGYPQNYYFDYEIQGEYLKFNNDDIQLKVEYINNIFYLIPSQKNLYDTEVQNNMKITVTDEKLNKVYKSMDGGTTWVDNEYPPIYICLDKYDYSHEVKEIHYTYYNNSDKLITTDISFSMFMLENNEWIDTPINDFVYAIEGLHIQANDTLTLDANFRDAPLNKGQYKIIKKAWYEGEKNNFKFEIEFNLY